MIVIPGVIGMCVFSPKLDDNRCSVRGIAFAEQLVARYSFHVYANRVRCADGEDPTVHPTACEEAAISQLLAAAAAGDLPEVKRIVSEGLCALEAADYDSRTALHLAASEGRHRVVKWILAQKHSDGGSNEKVSPRDRWGHTPLDDAVENKHEKVAKQLQAAQRFQSAQNLILQVCNEECLAEAEMPANSAESLTHTVDSNSSDVEVVLGTPVTSEPAEKQLQLLPDTGLEGVAMGVASFEVAD